MEKNRTCIVYRFDPKKNEVVNIKIDYAEPQNLPALAQIAGVHIPAIKALKADSNLLFERMDLDLPNMPITLKKPNIIEPITYINFVFTIQ